MFKPQKVMNGQFDSCWFIYQENCKTLCEELLENILSYFLRLFDSVETSTREESAKEIKRHLHNSSATSNQKGNGTSAIAFSETSADELKRKVRIASLDQFIKILKHADTWKLEYLNQSEVFKLNNFENLTSVFNDTIYLYKYLMLSAKERNRKKEYNRLLDNLNNNNSSGEMYRSQKKRFEAYVCKIVELTCKEFVFNVILFDPAVDYFIKVRNNQILKTTIHETIQRALRYSSDVRLEACTIPWSPATLFPDQSKANQEKEQEQQVKNKKRRIEQYDDDSVEQDDYVDSDDVNKINDDDDGDELNHNKFANSRKRKKQPEHRQLQDKLDILIEVNRGTRLLMEQSQSLLEKISHNSDSDVKEQELISQLLQELKSLSTDQNCNLLSIDNVSKKIQTVADSEFTRMNDQLEKQIQSTKTLTDQTMIKWEMLQERLTKVVSILQQTYQQNQDLFLRHGSSSSSDRLPAVSSLASSSSSNVSNPPLYSSLLASNASNIT